MFLLIYLFENIYITFENNNNNNLCIKDNPCNFNYSINLIKKNDQIFIIDKILKEKNLLIKFKYYL